jgi:tRNA threonylcarbamoyladenosine biosynthesis protein TsaE
VELHLRTATPADTRAVGASLAPLLRSGDVLLLAGDLGAGKTTLTAGVAEGLGAEEHVASPTFTLVREYPSGRLPVTHVDVYRLARVQDVLDLGLEETSGGADGVLVVEWGDAVEDLLLGERLRLVLTAPEPASEDRSIVATTESRAWDARGDALREALGTWIAA